MLSLTESSEYRVASLTLVMAVLAYSGLAMAMYPAVFEEMLASYVRQAVVIPILACVCLPIVSVALRPRSPFTYLLEVTRQGGGRFLLIIGVFCTGISAFTTFKLKIPEVVPFYADPFLADADAWLHQANPGEIAHAIVPSWAQYPLGYLYGPLWFLLWFGLTGFVALHRDDNLRLRYFWTMAGAFGLLGTVAATAFSSVGPVFYGRFFDQERFAKLMLALEQSAVGEYMQVASGYLLESYATGNNNMGTGISAMPSMHLAVVSLNALMLTSISRPAGVLAWIYVALIQIGSVYLGWHYAIDGYFSIVAVGVLWWAVGSFFAARRVQDGHAMASA